MIVDYLIGDFDTDNIKMDFKIVPADDNYKDFGEEEYVIRPTISFKDSIKEFSSNKCYCINKHKTVNIVVKPLDKNTLYTLIKYIKETLSILHLKRYNVSALKFNVYINTSEYNVKSQHKYFNLPTKTAKDGTYQLLVFVPNVIDRKFEIFLDLYDEEVGDYGEYLLELIDENTLNNNVISMDDISKNDIFKSEKVESFKIGELSFKTLKKYYLPRIIKCFNLIK